jgi:hypothetical protein
MINDNSQISNKVDFQLNELFQNENHRHLLFNILIYLNWEEILLFASSCKNIYYMIDKSLNENKYLNEKKKKNIELTDDIINRRKYDICDNEIFHHIYHVDKIIEEISLELIEFEKVYEIDRKTIGVLKTVFKNKNNDIISSIYIYSTKNKSKKYFNPFNKVAIYGMYNKMLEYKNNKGNIILQIGITSRNNPFLNTRKISWIQRNTSSDFPYVNNKKDLINSLPYYKYGFFIFKSIY